MLHTTSQYGSVDVAIAVLQDVESWRLGSVGKVIPTEPTSA